MPRVPLTIIVLAAAAAFVLAPASSAQASGVNVVPNPGFETGGCGPATPDVCGWYPFGDWMAIAQDGTDPHGGAASLFLSGGSGVAWATTDPGSCAVIGPGTHSASFWYRTPDQGMLDLNVAYLYLYVNFFAQPGCTGTSTFAHGAETQPILDNAWHQVVGSVAVPPGTASATFGLYIEAACEACQYLSANFDDLDVDGEPLADTTAPDTTITSGPPATMESRTWAEFEFTATDPAIFECAVDSGAFSACSSPKGYVLPTGTHTFSVRATDYSGNTDPTPAEWTWTILNRRPTAAFALSCVGLQCSYDGTRSYDLDGTIAAYDWRFGDGSSGSGPSVTHTYLGGGSYTVTLTVTDNEGASASASQTVTLIGLTARGYKARGVQNVDLSWTGPGAISFDVYRNGAKIATISNAAAYTDTVGRGPGTYTYRVCSLATSTCSNDVTVTF